MEMARTHGELRALSDEELIRQHDELAKGTLVGLNHYREELARREQNKQSRLILALTVVTTAEAAVSFWDIVMR